MESIAPEERDVAVDSVFERAQEGDGRLAGAVAGTVGSERRVRGPSVENGGLDLGLFVVRSIAESWGGAVEAHPWPSADAAEGNEFGVLVPRERPVASPTNARSSR